MAKNPRCPRRANVKDLFVRPQLGEIETFFNK